MKPETRQMVASFCRAMECTANLPTTDAESVAKSLRGVAAMIEAIEQPWTEEVRKVMVRQ